MPPSNIMMRCLSVASISAATPAQNHYLNFSLMMNFGFALIQHIISNMMCCLSVASVSAATPAWNHYLNFSLMINSGFALTEHIISKFSTTKQNWNNKKYRKIKHTMERKILCWICLLFTVAKCSLEHLQTLAVILFLIFQKYKADKTLPPKGHNIYLPWAASAADDAAFHFCTNRIWMTIKSSQGESYIQT